MNTSKKTRNLVYYAMIMAIIVMMAAVPFLGYVQIFPIAITLVHIPVIIGTILFGWKAGFLFGLTFGVSSMIVAITRGAATDLLFINPLISVVPRIMFGLIIYPIYRLFERIQSSEALSIGLTAFVSSFVHSVLVLAAIFLLLTYEGKMVGSTIFQQLLATVLTVNVSLEAVASTIVAIPLVKAVRASLRIYSA